MIRKGDAVTIRPEYRAAGEGLRLYLAASDEVERVFVKMIERN